MTEPIHNPNEQSVEATSAMNNERSRTQPMEYDPPPPYNEAVGLVHNPPPSILDHPPARPPKLPTYPNAQLHGNRQHQLYSVHISTQVQPLRPLGPSSEKITCPYCLTTIFTSTTKMPSTATYLSSLILCLFGGQFCCCLCPFCLECCYDVDHYCPNCKSYIGKFSGSGY